MAIVYAKSSLSTTTDHGVIIRMYSGEVWDSDDPVVLSRPHLFQKTPPRVRTSKGHRPYDDVVERATAAPGEKRRTKRA